jgi:branched-chain amino acid transport system permease protein
MGQQIVHSLALGSIYALLAVGLTCMGGAQRSLCLAYGGFYAFGGYVAWWAMRATTAVWVALSVVVGCGMVIGYLVHWWWRLARTKMPEYFALLAGLGLLVCLEEAYRLGIGPYRLQVIAVQSHQVSHIGPLLVTDVHWLVFGCTFALLTVVQGFLTTSQSGRALQGLLRGDPIAAWAIPHISHLRLLAGGLGAVLAGVSGVLAGLYLNDVYPAMGTHMTHKLLILMLLSAPGNVHRALVMAFGLAFLEGVGLPATRLRLPPEAVLLVALAGVSLLSPSEEERAGRLPGS